ncbi:MAG: D-alanyl-D-alanine carboxypeptidase family protein [Patescibacteria group bacterium]
MKAVKLMWRDKKYIWPAAGVVILIVGLVWFGEYRRSLVLAQLQATEQMINANLASTTEIFNSRIRELGERLDHVVNESSALGSKLSAEQERTAAVQDQIGKIHDTVGTLDQLSKTDPQLLQKYSKTYFLNEHYVPAKLTVIPSDYLFDKNKSIEFYFEAWPFLEKMFKVASAAGVDMRALSAYRSFGTQSSLKASYRLTYGAGTANQFSAEQGYSEHQLGTTIDFTTATVGATLVGFEKTPAYRWLVDHAHEYGFVLSYPENNKYYQYEPWHWRFVGVDLATRLKRENKYFYDLDQREINNYLLVIFE